MGGGVGVAPHAPKKNYFFAVFLAFLKALLVGLPFEPGERILSGVFPAAFCALILRLLAAMFEYSPLPIYLLLDLVPEHFQRFRERRKGEFGLAAALGCFFICPADRAQ